MDSPLLDLKNISMSFGGLIAVNNVNFSINNKELVAIIGPNGAGKTTLFNMITGIYTPSTGEIFLNKKKINAKSPNEITTYGVARTFQNIRLFKNLSVLDNLKVARHSRIEYSFFDGIFKTKKYYLEERKIEEDSLKLLELFNLLEQKNNLAKNLSYGDQRKLEMARALATKPKILLLDEPAAGMNPTETKELSALIRFIREKFEIAVILIEHDMHLVMEIAEKIFVFDYGHLIAEGSPLEIQSNPLVIKAYLGGEIT